MRLPEEGVRCFCDVGEPDPHRRPPCSPLFTSVTSSKADIPGGGAALAPVHIHAPATNSVI